MADGISFESIVMTRMFGHDEVNADTKPETQNEGLPFQTTPPFTWKMRLQAALSSQEIVQGKKFGLSCLYFLDLKDGNPYLKEDVHIGKCRDSLLLILFISKSCRSCRFLSRETFLLNLFWVNHGRFIQFSCTNIWIALRQDLSRKLERRRVIVNRPSI